MGTGTPDSSVKEINCAQCGRSLTDGFSTDCDWWQGRCPYRFTWLDWVLNNSHTNRFYNLIKFFTGRR